MRRRWIVLLVMAFVLAGGSFALGAAGSGPPSRMPTMGQMAAACDAMHRSAAMREMLQMPSDLRERCDAMHDQTLQMGGSGMMMGGPGMMGGS